MFWKRRPYRLLAVLLLVGYFALAAAYVLLAGWVTAREHGHAMGHWPAAGAGLATVDGDSWSTLTLLPRLNEVVVFTFFFVCGASVGSFLNVVVWRLPQGLGVNGHSFCPRCRHALRARDNVPVFGWLWLGGRCRDCRLPISSRYPVVEAAVGFSFAVLGTVELYGWNLPYRSGGGLFSMAAPLIDGAQLVTVGYHLVGLAIAWAMGLIRYDGNRIPARLVVFAAVWLIGAMLVMPSLAIVPWQLSLPGQSQFVGLAQWPPADWLFSASAGFSPVVLVQTLVRLLTSLVAAVFFARVLSRAFCVRADLKLDPLGDPTLRLVDLIKMLAVVSILVGWQATSGVLIAASLLACLFQGSGRGADALGRFSLALPVALLWQIVFWRQLVESGWWPSEQAPRAVLLGYALGTLLIPLWLRERTPSACAVDQVELDLEPPDDPSDECPPHPATAPMTASEQKP